MFSVLRLILALKSLIYHNIEKYFLTGIWCAVVHIHLNVESQADCKPKIMKLVARKYKRYQMLCGLLVVHLEQAG